MKTTLIIQSGQYEQAAIRVTVNHKTWRGLCRRITQLENQYSVYGDNWAGWIKPNVALASENDEWRDNHVIGGQHCFPANGWLVVDPETATHYDYMTYPDLKTKLGF
jgi:hypothetical protein